MNEIIYRKNSITDADIVDGNCFVSHAMSGETLASDTLDFRLWSDTGLGKVDADLLEGDGKDMEDANGLILRCMTDEDYTEFVPGSDLEYKRNDKLVGKFYLRDVKRAGKYMYDFSCVSAIGILGDTMHYGGIYTGQTVATVATEILEGLPYEIDPMVGDIKLYGWLPFDTKRNNLQQITIATAIAVRTKPDGSLLLTALSNDVKGNIGADRVAIGGNVAVDTPYSAVQVSEHYYQALDDEIVLFSESSVKTEFLKFNEPVHDITVTGGTILESGANYAIVQCSGFTEVKAKKYLHTTRTVTIGTVDGLPSDKIYSVNSATLITSLNSSGVAQKLYEAYTQPKTIQANVFYGNEKAGDVVNVINPYSQNTESAFLKKQDINISNKLLVNSDMVVDFTPSGAVTGYKNRVLITEGTSWTVPEGVTEIRAVLIGGGNGGQAGKNGASAEQKNITFDGQYPPSPTNVIDPDVNPTNEVESYNSSGGEGGEGGVKGEAGKVFDTGAIAVSPSSNISLSIGYAGDGGTTNGSNGTTGGETEFGMYSTTDGNVKPNGYIDIITGQEFAMPSADGFKGSDGRGSNRLGENANSLMPTNYIRDFWESITRYSPVAGNLIRWLARTRNVAGDPKAAYGTSGSGGGCSYTADGGKGTDGYWDDFKNEPRAGNGGKGADGGAAKNASTYGGGGFGGHGGGGGGGHGWYAINGYNAYKGWGTAGSGGAFGPGGDGKQGCIIIYY